MEADIELLNRITRAMRPLTETWATLPEEEQQKWASFFDGYVRNVLKATTKESVKDLGGAIAQVWAMAHEYHRLYGFLWK